MDRGTRQLQGSGGLGHETKKVAEEALVQLVELLTPSSSPRDTGKQTDDVFVSETSELSRATHIERL